MVDMSHIHLHFHDETKHDPATGQFTSGSGGAKKPHRRNAKLTSLHESPLGWTYGKDEDGNHWFYNQNRHIWRATHKEVGGEGWRETTGAHPDLMRRPKQIPR